MFSIVNHFQMFKPGNVNEKRPGLKMAKEGVVHIINTQSNKMNIIQHIAKAFSRKYSHVTPFAIINIFMNCNLITHSFSVAVTNYRYTHLVIKLHNFDTCNWLLANTDHRAQHLFWSSVVNFTTCFAMCSTLMGPVLLELQCAELQVRDTNQNSYNEIKRNTD